MAKIRLNTTRKLNAYRLKRQAAIYRERGFIKVGKSYVKQVLVERQRCTAKSKDKR